MAKIDRYNGNLQSFASAAPGTERTIFGDVAQANDLTSQINADFLRGWGIVGPSDQPALEDFNGAMYTHGQLLAYLHQVGVAEYNATQEYHLGSLCNLGGAMYASKVNNNTGNAPASSPAQWGELYAQATETVRGTAAIATTLQATTGTDDASIMTPKKVKEAIDGKITLPLPVNQGGTGATSAAQARTNLALGTAATVDRTTSQTDSTAGRALLVGDFGLGAASGGAAPDVADADLATGGGFYVFSTGALNTPPQITGRPWICIASPGGLQIASPDTNVAADKTRVFSRRYTSGSWSPWVEFYNSGNIADLDARFLGSPRVDVASAASVNLSTLPAGTDNINITGTVAITAFTVTAGRIYYVRFAGATTLTNGASLVTQSGTNIVTAAGDTCIIRATANNVIEVLCYTPGIPQSLGYSQTLQVLTGSRSLNTSFTNTTGRTIFVVAVGVNVVSGDTTSTLTVDGIVVSNNTRSQASEPSTHYGLVPNGSVYRFNSPGNTNLSQWVEYR